MPTLTWLDSFDHQQTTSQFYGTGAGIWDTNSNAPGITYPVGRRPGSHAVQLAQDGVTSTRLGKTVVAGNRTLVESFYMKVSAAPSVTSNAWTGVATVNALIRVETATGKWLYTAGSGTDAAINGGVNYCDGQWHRIDLKWVTSGTTYTLDVTFDGVAQTQHVSNSTTAADITETRLGSNTNTHTLTVQLTDWVRSFTAADHPIGPHKCLSLQPVSDGAHNWASTKMGSETGGVASSVTTLWQSVDDWVSGAADTSTFIQYANTVATATEYAEIICAKVEPSTVVWAVRAAAAILSGGTQANSATTRIVDGSGSTVLDLYTGDQSDTANRYQASILSGVTTAAALNALKWRVGFPTDSNPAPEWSALMFDYATFDSDVGLYQKFEPVPFIPRGRSM